MRFLSIVAASAVTFSHASFAQDQSKEPCGLVADITRQASGSDQTTYDTTLVYNCLRSVPFNATAASIYINFVNATFLQFQSTTAYLLDPPPSYQQPAVDLNAYMGTIKTRVTNGTYKNQYDFELDIFKLVQSSHDGHFDLPKSITEIFRFKPPLNFVSLSSDGTSIPQVYAFEDINQTSYDNLDWEASPVHSINGQYALSYLSDWASQWVPAQIEDHGDWNNVMYSPASAIYSNPSIWKKHLFLTETWLNITFANGTTYSQPFFSTLSKSANSTLVEQMTNGQDFYDLFVAARPETPLPSADEYLEELLASLTSTASPIALPTQTDSPFASGWPEPQYPEPFLKQEGLGPVGKEGDGNWASAYTVSDGNVAVFSIPTFQMNSKDTIQNFVNFTKTFIAEATEAGIKKVLFDVQSNNGGSLYLSYEMYKLFFPAADPWSGNRIRFHPVAEDLGKAWSRAWDNSTASDDGSADLLKNLPWVAQTTINAKTGQNWAYWDELSNPYFDNGDWFMENSIIDFTYAEISIDGFGDKEDEVNDPQPFATEDMAILTDGNCHSTCTLFVELFSHQAGVKNVVVGGVPEVGPMQVTSGVRGSQDIAIAAQKLAFNAIEIIYPQYLDQPLPDIRNTGFKTSGGNYNLRDTIRVNETFPQQFAYHAAGCRFFYTQDTWSNFTALWEYAVSAAFDDDSKCVTGSTGQYSALNPYFTDVCGPNTTNCDLDSGVETWGTSNATVFQFPDFDDDGSDDSSDSGDRVSSSQTTASSTKQPGSATGSPAPKGSGAASPLAASTSATPTTTANNTENPSSSASGATQPSANKSNSAVGLSVNTIALLATFGLAVVF